MTLTDALNHPSRNVSAKKVSQLFLYLPDACKYVVVFLGEGQTVDDDGRPLFLSAQEISKDLFEAMKELQKQKAGGQIYG